DQLEGRLAEYKEREVKYIETVRSLEKDKEYNLRKINKLTSEVETLQEEKDVVDGKLARLLKSSKDLENIIESQRSEKVKEGVGYNVVPPPAADLYLSPMKDLSWTGLPEFVDDTVTDYSRPSPTTVVISLILLKTVGEGSKGRQIGLKIIHIRVLHIDLLVTDQMELI
nr:hypothetical protein [Tanacetum cinerariifolium]